MYTFIFSQFDNSKLNYTWNLLLRLKVTMVLYKFLLDIFL